MIGIDVLDVEPAPAHSLSGALRDRSMRDAGGLREGAVDRGAVGAEQALARI